MTEKVLFLTDEDLEYLKAIIDHYRPGSMEHNSLDELEQKLLGAVSLNIAASQIMIKSAAASLGAKGGQSTSEAKKAAAQENGKKGGRPRKQK